LAEDVHGCAWMCMDVRGCAWMCMDAHNKLIT